MLLRKTLSLNDVALKMDGDAGRFSGYASKFGGVDSYGDTIVAGAFAHTLRANGKPKMFLEHAPFMFGSGAASLPIGKWTVAKEDDIGLFVEGELTPGMSLAADVHSALKHGTLDGLSIGGFVKKGDYDETETGRVIRRWSKLMEVSLVAFPADAAARVESVKAGGADVMEAIDEAETLKEIEELLRDCGTFSQRAATAIVARIKALQGEPAEAKVLQSMAERMARLAA
jgi:hypothetical protein